MVQARKIWNAGHRPFEDVSSDTFVLARPRGNMLWTCDPSIPRQLSTQPDSFQVATKLNKFYDLWDPTIRTTEGVERKAHRKVVTSAFTPSTNAAVWKESVTQALDLTEHWTGQGSLVPVARTSTLILALHVIHSIFFHKIMSWYEHSGSYCPPKWPNVSSSCCKDDMLYLTSVDLGTKMPMGKRNQLLDAISHLRSRSQLLSHD